MRLVVAIATLLAPAPLEQAQHCWDRWQGRPVSIAGTIERVETYPSGWSVYTSSPLTETCRIVEIYRHDVPDPLCVAGADFAASGIVNANQRTDFLRVPDQPDLELRAASIICGGED
jgi:hypothetical protein